MKRIKLTSAKNQGFCLPQNLIWSASTAPIAGANSPTASTDTSNLPSDTVLMSLAKVLRCHRRFSIACNSTLPAHAGLGMNGKHRTWGQYNCTTHTFDKTASVQTLMKWQSGNQARSCRNTLPSERQGLPLQTGRKTERHPVRCLSSGINQPT